MSLEKQILCGLVHNESFARKVIPFISPDYFTESANRVVVDEITKFFNEYNKLPTKEILEIQALNRTDIKQDEATEVEPTLVAIFSDDPQDAQWLTDETEKYFKKRAAYLAVLDCISILENQNGKRHEDEILGLFQDALSVSFDSDIGHDYFDNARERFDFYQQNEFGILFDLELFNKITGGVGLRNKTLSCVAARTGGGKTIFMCHVAAGALMQGKNVLYVTMEMSEEMIAQRIDANLFDVDIAKIKGLDKKSFTKKIDVLKSRTLGNLIVKEYPTGGAHCGHIRTLLEDLKAKKEFVPDLVVVDYLNILTSQRVRSVHANSYTVVKSIAEEMRSLAIVYDVPFLTGTQINRAALGASDIDMGDTAESVGVLHTLDLYFALIRTEELDELGQVMVKQLKNRHGDTNYYKRFIIGLEPSRMRYFDVESNAQENVDDNGYDDADAPMFDKTSFGKRVNTEGFQFE